MRCHKLLLIVVQCLTLVFTKTYKHLLTFDVFNDNTIGHLIDVQKQSFRFGPNGSITVHLSCNLPSNISWGDSTAFNIFLCEEATKTRWLYLYPDWGMCFQQHHYYHHCSIDKLTKTSPTTWYFNKTMSAEQDIVGRMRTCPIYTAPRENTMSVANQGISYIVRTYRCEYTGIFLNDNSRLSEDEVWNPLLYGMLTVIYGAMATKAVYEIVRHWKYRVNCSFYMYALVFLKFINILITFLYYRKILFEDDLMVG